MGRVNEDLVNDTVEACNRGMTYGRYASTQGYGCRINKNRTVASILAASDKRERKSSAGMTFWR